MQAAGMLRGTRAICLLVLLVPLIGISHSLPLQLLPSIPGYIPVYIRNGDQPLEEINPALAEAFHETSSLSKSIRLDNAPGQVDVNPAEDEANASVGSTKEKTNYPVHVRQVESGSEEQGRVKDDEDEDKKRTDNNSRVTDVPKLLSIYELYDDDRAKKASNPKPPMMKMNEPAPPTKEEREEFGIHAGKEDGKPQDSHEQSPNFPELPAEVPQRHDEIARGFPANKPGTSASESIPRATVHVNKDDSPAIDQKDEPVSTADEKEVPAKLKNQPEVMTNVPKLSPPTVPDSADDESNSTSKEIFEENKSKDLAAEKDDVSSF